jgi:phage baseplate assembly protein W
VHPDFDVPRGDPGLEVSAAGRIEMVEDQAAVRQSILLLLSTTPGERVMRPDYGCDLRGLVFSPNDATTAGLAAHAVRQALRRWEPRVEVLRLDAGPNPGEPGRLDIVLEYRVRSSRRTGQLGIAVDLSGETP